MLRKNSDKDELDLLTYIFMGRYLEHMAKFETSYHFYNLAHLCGNYELIFRSSCDWQ